MAFYWVNIYTEFKGSEPFHKYYVIDGHPFRFIKDLQSNSEKATKEKQKEMRSKCRDINSDKHVRIDMDSTEFDKIQWEVPVHQLSNWKEITEEEYRLFMELNK